MNGTAPPREAMGGVGHRAGRAGVLVRRQILNSDVPQPRYNVFLRAADGTDIGEADA